MSQAELRAEYNRRRSQPCADCGRRFPVYVMALDHTRGEALFTPSAFTRGPRSELASTKKRHTKLGSRDRTDSASGDYGKWMEAIRSHGGDRVAAACAEWDKCDPVDENCHRRRGEERRLGLPLGSLLDELMLSST